MKRIPDGPYRTNCLFWALLRWYRKRWRGYIIFRQSAHHPFKIHCMWSSSGKYWWGYAPLRPVNNFIALCHGVRFRGHIKLERE